MPFFILQEPPDQRQIRQIEARVGQMSEPEKAAYECTFNRVYKMIFNQLTDTETDPGTAAKADDSARLKATLAASGAVARYRRDLTISGCDLPVRRAVGLTADQKASASRAWQAARSADLAKQVYEGVRRWRLQFPNVDERGAAAWAKNAVAWFKDPDGWDSGRSRPKNTNRHQYDGIISDILLENGISIGEQYQRGLPK